MSPTFVGGSDWANAFLSARFGGSQVPFTIPSGGSPDVTALGRLQFDATTWADVELVAARIHATEAVLVLAIPIPGKIQLWLKRIGAAETPTKTTLDVPLDQSVPQTYPKAADAAVHAIEDMWRQRGPIEFTSKGSLVADVHVASLQQWSTIQSAMGLIANVRDVAVVAMDIGLVRVSVTYLGTVEQLHDALLPVGVSLTKDDAGWSISYAQPMKPSTASETP
jgi:hypothetical protein